MSFLKKAKLALESGTTIAKNVISGEEITVSAEIVEKRLETCKGCPHFEPKLERCMECGCFMKIKSGLAGMKCPLNKWEQ